MTSRRSSGSMRAESAVEPTRSENITVTWRRSAVSWGFGSVNAGCGDAGAAPASSAIAAQHLAPMSERYADLFKIMIRQMGKHRNVDVVIRKCAGRTVPGQSSPASPQSAASLARS